MHYENFRSQRLSKGGAHAASKALPLSDKDIKDKMLAEKDEELRRMQVCTVFILKVSYKRNFR